jgi:flagellar hook-length control protein FliK
MLPTLTIPSLPRPPCSGEQAGAAAVDSEGGDAFADALQHAREPRAAHTHEPRQHAAKAADAPTRSRAAQAKGAAHESADKQPAGDTAVSDTAARTTTSEATAVDAAPRATDASEGTTPLPPPAAIAADAAMTPQAAVEASRSVPPRAADTDDAALAIDSRDRRSASRIAPNDARAARPSQSPLGSPAEPGAARETATAPPLRTLPEHASNDVAATPVGALRAPSFERSPIEATPSMLAATLLARDGAAAATAAGAESKLPQATLHAAIDQPGFGAAVGSQVALWVREGVQEARLQLHPAELGPVTVQITLDGQAAHVDFTAAVAATRESIEQSLPALATALRESGFTLVGGGVSSDAGQAGHDTRRERTRIGDGGDRSRSQAAGDGGHAVTAPRRWTRSLLDVYA